MSNVLYSHTFDFLHQTFDLIIVLPTSPLHKTHFPQLFYKYKYRLGGLKYR